MITISVRTTKFLLSCRPKVLAGLKNAPDIYALPGCDAIFIGPNDLRFQMRTPDGTMPTPEAHEAMVQRVIEVGKQTGCATGIHAMDCEAAKERAEQGMTFYRDGPAT